MIIDHLFFYMILFGNPWQSFFGIICTLEILLQLDLYIWTIYLLKQNPCEFEYFINFHFVIL